MSADHDQPATPQTPQLSASSGRLLAANSALSLALSIAANGAIVSLRHQPGETEFVDASAAEADGLLWRLQLAAGGGSASLTNRDCTHFTYEIAGDPARPQLHLRWRGLRLRGAEIPGEVTARLTLPPDEPVALLECELALAAHLRVEAQEFPILPALGPSESLAKDAAFLPLSGGLLVPNPGAALSLSADGAGFAAPYPGPASMQIIGYLVGDKASAWLACRDASGAPKTFLAGPMPRVRRLSLSVLHHPGPTEPGAWSLGYPTVVGVSSGSWFEAARHYRAWALGQPWCARGRGGERPAPAITRSHGLWVSHRGGAGGAVAVARELQRIVNVPVKLDWHSWHAGEVSPPESFSPRDGDAAFARALEQLAQAGALVQLALDGALSGDLDGDEWQSTLVRLAREAAARGCAGLYLAGRGRGLSAVGPAGQRPDWRRAMRAVLLRIKEALGHSAQLALDGPVEPHLDLADAFVSPHAAAERAGLAGDGGRSLPIPLFAAVYHDFSTAIGPGLSLASTLPRESQPAGGPGEERGPANAIAQNYEAQFCLEAARALVWGHQASLEAFHLEESRSEPARRRLAFLAAVLRAQAWGVGALLPYAQFMGPLPIACRPIEVDLLIRPPGSPPPPRRARRRLCPALGSAWRLPGSGLALVLANLHTDTVEFASPLHPERLGLAGPLRLLGRTFSEHGDVPGATLRASGAEIGGRLPPRSLVLVSLG